MKQIWIVPELRRYLQVHLTLGVYPLKLNGPQGKILGINDLVAAHFSKYALR